MSSFGQRLKFLREERGDNQEKIANMLGISRAAISKYENDEREPDMKTILALTNYFDVSVDFLFGKTPIRGNPHNIQENLKLIFGESPIEQIQADILRTIGVNFSIEDLKNYISGNRIPSLKSLIALADYAQVSLDFFYRKNTPESLKNEQENFKNNGDNAFSDHEVIEDMLIDKNYIKLAKWIKKRNLSPEKIIKLLEKHYDNRQ